MKTIIKGMTLLLAGVMVMSCSKDVTFDENAQKQAKIEQQFAQYEANFVKRFGSIAPTQDWGFGDEAKGIIVTRGESYGGSKKPYDCGFEVPNSITEHQNGNWANGAAAELNAGKGYTSIDALYNNYWVQQANIPEGKHKNISLEAYDSSTETGGWVAMADFVDGNNQTQKYFQTNSKTHGTTLMTNMGGAGCNGSAANGGDAAKGKFFRMKTSSGYSYDYKFLDYTKDGHTFFLVAFPITKNNGTTIWWIVLIEEATQKLDVVEEGRIMCEDLGDTDDFDFNDVVFDAKRFNNGTIEVTLIAAGGELPITVAGVDVHAKIGSMVNTGRNEGSTYTFPVTGYSSIKNIPVIVYPDGIGEEAVKYQLNAEIGKVPQKICTPRGCHYPEEKVNINDAYSEFSTWVQNDNPAVYLWDENIRKTDLDPSTK